MSYFDIATLGADTDFQARVAACYAIETLVGEGIHPGQWAIDHSWDMAAQPGFGDAYAYALASDNLTPGRDPAVITDAQILAAVQNLLP